MNIAVYGAGYVGLVSAACLAYIGHTVICVDIDAAKIESLKQGECPFYEKGLPEILAKQLACGRLSFTTNIEQAVHWAATHFIAAGTPAQADGSSDLSQVEGLVRTIAETTRQNCLLIIKSTVPVGSGVRLQHLANCINDTLCIRLASNPEFLREGSAVSDFLNADRIIVGGDHQSLKVLEQVYAPLTEQGIPLLSMDISSAELSKYAANAMLATKISFINQISQIAEASGANIDLIRQSMALDPRIGPHFIQPGIGYGGSCFPKDVQSLIHRAEELGVDNCLLSAVEQINQVQRGWMMQKLQVHFRNRLSGLTLGIWGLAFKPETDDLREACSISVIHALLQAGVTLLVYDPEAMQNAKALFAGCEKLIFCNSAREVILQNINGLLIMTEWQQFCDFPLSELAEALGEAPIFDGRNCFGLQAVESCGIGSYYSVGRPRVMTSKVHREYEVHAG